MLCGCLTDNTISLFSIGFFFSLVVIDQVDQIRFGVYDRHMFELRLPQTAIAYHLFHYSIS